MIRPEILARALASSFSLPNMRATRRSKVRSRKTQPDISARKGNVILALEHWVEVGIAPDYLIATTGPQPIHNAENPTNPASFTRKLCPYPQVAEYDRSGDPNSASSFVCVAGGGNNRTRD